MAGKEVKKVFYPALGFCFDRQTFTTQTATCYIADRCV